MFIQCILDGYGEGQCQRQQDVKDREEELKNDHEDHNKEFDEDHNKDFDEDHSKDFDEDDNKDFGIVESIGSRLYFSSWMLFSHVIYEIISKLL